MRMNVVREMQVARRGQTYLNLLVLTQNYGNHNYNAESFSVNLLREQDADKFRTAIKAEVNF